MSAQSVLGRGHKRGGYANRVPTPLSKMRINFFNNLVEMVPPPEWRSICMTSYSWSCVQSLLIITRLVVWCFMNEHILNSIDVIHFLTHPLSIYLSIYLISLSHTYTHTHTQSNKLAATDIMGVVSHLCEGVLITRTYCPIHSFTHSLTHSLS